MEKLLRLENAKLREHLVQHVPDTAKLYVSTDGGANFTGYPMTASGASTFTATFPPVACGQNIRYYVGAQLSNGGLNVDPSTAPATSFGAPVQTGSALVLSETFEGGANGWTASNDAALTAGGWAQGVPVGGALEYLDDGTLLAAMNARRSV